LEIRGTLEEEDGFLTSQEAKPRSTHSDREAGFTHQFSPVIAGPLLIACLGPGILSPLQAGEDGCRVPVTWQAVEKVSPPAVRMPLRWHYQQKIKPRRVRKCLQQFGGTHVGNHAASAVSTPR